jgi:hypothetical protein
MARMGEVDSWFLMGIYWIKVGPGGVFFGKGKALGVGLY